MDKKNKILLLILSVLIIGIIPFVLGIDVVTIDTPSASSVLNGSSYTLIATVDSVGAGNNNSIMDFYYSLTATGAWVQIGAVENDTTDDLSFNITFDTTALSDATTIRINATYSNASHLDSGGANKSSAVRSSVPVDNTNPTCSVITDFPVINPLEAITLTCTGADGVHSTLSYQQNLRDGDSLVSTASNGTTGIDTFQDSDTGTLGEFTAICTVSDAVPFLGVCTETFRINIEGDDGIGDIGDGGDGTPQFLGMALTQIIVLSIIAFIIIVIVIVVIAISLSKKKAKKRRK